jgi:FkbM family methyltransferase
MSSTAVASKAERGAERLAPLFVESRAEARDRELEIACRVTSPDAPPVILFGAGGLGRRVRAALASAGAPPVAFTDNDRRLWDTSVDGVAVISPAQAAARYAGEGLFVVTAWNPDHAFVDTARQLHRSGCREVISWIPLAWGLAAADLLPSYAAGRPSDVLAAADRVMLAASVWADGASLDEFVRQTRWRLSGDFADLADPAPDQYFPADLLTLRPGEVFVDCGAFDGDTLRELVARCPEFGSVDAFEPDAGNFAILQRRVATLPSRCGGRIRLHRAATDAECGARLFAGVGASGAFVEAPAEAAVAGGAVQAESVPCVRLDDALEGVPVTFIKMDVEGAEAGTLRGAEGLLRGRRPVLAVSAYHHQADLWRLPALLATLADDYRLHLRAHRPDGFDCVLYAIPAERGES